MDEVKVQDKYGVQTYWVETVHYIILLLSWMCTHVSRNTAFPTRVHVHPAKTQISLRIRAIWTILAGTYESSNGSEASSGGQRRLLPACASTHHYENMPIQIYWKFPPPPQKKMKIFRKKKYWYFSYFCSKHRLWVPVRTASPRRF